MSVARTEDDTVYMLDMCKQLRAFCDTLDANSAQWALGAILAHLTIRAHHEMSHDMGDVMYTLSIAAGNRMDHLNV